MPSSLLRLLRTMFAKEALLALLSAVVIGIPTANAQSRQNEDYCTPSGTFRVILIDVTTPYDKTDKDAISSIIQRTLIGAGEGDRIVVRTITDSYTRSERLIERCIPSCKAEGIRRLTCNDGLMRVDRDKIRSDMIEVLGSKLSKFEELKYSDIIRTINRSANEDIGSNQKIEIIIYSDLIENSDYLVTKSFFYYSTEFLMAGLKKLGFVPDLRGANVNVAGVGRSDAADRHPLGLKEMSKINEFWRAYFSEAKAGSVYIGQNLAAR
jgi:hypothetical protein